MKKGIKYNRITMFLLVVLGVLTLGGCGAKMPTMDQVDTSTIGIAKNGQVEVYLVETFDKAYYQEAELEEMITAEIEDYNAQAKAGEEEDTLPVSLEELVVEENQVMAHIRCVSAQDYTNYSGNLLYLATVMEANSVGYPMKGQLYRVEDGSAFPTEEITQEAHVLLFAENISVWVPYDIVAVSQGVTVDGNTVTFEGDGSSYAYVLMK